MTFEEWIGDNVNYLSSREAILTKAAWEEAFNQGVKWALEQDASTLNKLQLTMEKTNDEL